MTMSRMRLEQMERSGVAAFLCHEAGDFAKLSSGGEFWD
jgi:N-acyl homoserine lactone hydrolase